MRRSERQSGFTLLEAVFAMGLMAVVAVVSVQSVTSLGQASRRCMAEQEAGRIAGLLLNRVVRELRFAEASTVTVPVDDPETIRFQEVLAYEANPGTQITRVLSRPIWLRMVPVGGSTLFAIERSLETAWTTTTTVIICETDADGASSTETVPLHELEEHLAAGATLGPCGGEPIPVAHRASMGAPEVFGAGVAKQDLLIPDLPGLHFGVRVVGELVFVDVALTVEARAGAEVIRRRLQTSVRLLNR